MSEQSKVMISIDKEELESLRSDKDHLQRELHEYKQKYFSDREYWQRAQVKLDVYSDMLENLHEKLVNKS